MRERENERGNKIEGGHIHKLGDHEKTEKKRKKRKKGRERERVGTFNRTFELNNNNEKTEPLESCNNRHFGWSVF